MRKKPSYEELALGRLEKICRGIVWALVGICFVMWLNLIFQW